MYGGLHKQSSDVLTKWTYWPLIACSADEMNPITVNYRRQLIIYSVRHFPRPQLPLIQQALSNPAAQPCTRRNQSAPTANWRNLPFKPGFHYPSWRPDLTAQVDGWSVSITRQHGPSWRARVPTSRVDGQSTRLVETRTRQHGPCWRVMETGHLSTRAVNSGSGNRALDSV